MLLDAGLVVRNQIEWAAPALQNQTGQFTVLDDTGLKVDRVAYTKGRARREGWTSRSDLCTNKHCCVWSRNVKCPSTFHA